jgi:hypothetical protein
MWNSPMFPLCESRQQARRLVAFERAHESVDSDCNRGIGRQLFPLAHQRLLQAHGPRPGGK